ncbi:MAG: ion transporter [Oscillatoriales cyanobacterium RM1_1_9]|nr:ion transporter [Oscillatoriales cyanobacterium RM1_1_9]
MAHSNKFWQQLRQDVAFYLEDLETPIGKLINFNLAGLILLSAAIFVIQTYPVSLLLRMRLEVLDRGILVCFAAEYLTRLWVAENRLKFCFHPLAIIDLVVLSPLFLGLFNLSFLRVIRWFRVLRLIRFINVKFLSFQIQQEDGVILTRILFTLVTIIFVFSGLIYQVENPVNPQIFRTFLDAVYFCVVTMTTVGFGDVTPQSEAGRFLTILMILTGIALIPWQIGDLIKQLLKTTQQMNMTCSQCQCRSHAADAHFCKQCGARLNLAPLSPGQHEFDNAG